MRMPTQALFKPFQTHHNVGGLPQLNEKLKLIGVYVALVIFHLPALNLDIVFRLQTLPRTSNANSATPEPLRIIIQRRG